MNRYISEGSPTNAQPRGSSTRNQIPNRGRGAANQTYNVPGNQTYNVPRNRTYTAPANRTYDVPANRTYNVRGNVPVNRTYNVRGNPPERRTFIIPDRNNAVSIYFYRTSQIAKQKELKQYVFTASRCKRSE